MDLHCVYEDYTIKETIENFEKNHERVAIVLSGSDKVIGVVSQGDIIRALSAGTSLFTKVSGIINPSFMYMTDKDLGKAYDKFKAKQITMMPVVDKDFALVDVITMKDIYEYMEQKAK